MPRGSKQVRAYLAYHPMNEVEALGLIGGPGTVVYLWSRGRPEEDGFQRLADAVEGAIDPAEAEAVSWANGHDVGMLCDWLEERGCAAVDIINIRLSWPRAGVLVMGPGEIERIFGGDTAATREALLSKRLTFLYWSGQQVQDWFVTDDGCVDDGFDAILGTDPMYPMVGDIVDMGGPVIGYNNTLHAVRESMSRYRRRRAEEKQKKDAIKARKKRGGSDAGFTTAYDLYASSRQDGLSASRQLRSYTIQLPTGIDYYVTDDGSPFEDGDGSGRTARRREDMVGETIWQSGPYADEDEMIMDLRKRSRSLTPLDDIRHEREAAAEKERHRKEDEEFIRRHGPKGMYG